MLLRQHSHRPHMATPHRISLLVDDHQECWRDCIHALLSSAHWWMRPQGVSGHISIHLGRLDTPSASYTMSLVDSIVEHTGTMMTAHPSSIDCNPKPPKGYTLAWAPNGDLTQLASILGASEQETVRQLVHILNRAFSRYEWYIETSPEEYQEWLRANKPTIIAVINTARQTIASYLAFFSYKALDGTTTTYISEVAVDPNHQGKGIGKTLLCNLLTEANTERIVVDAASSVEPFYAKLGFKEEILYYRLCTSLDTLPDTPLAPIKPNQRT